MDTFKERDGENFLWSSVKWVGSWFTWGWDKISYGV